jgi:hypothetical protein
VTLSIYAKYISKHAKQKNHCQHNTKKYGDVVPLFQCQDLHLDEPNCSNLLISPHKLELELIASMPTQVPYPVPATPVISCSSVNWQLVDRQSTILREKKKTIIAARGPKV